MSPIWPVLGILFALVWGISFIAKIFNGLFKPRSCKKCGGSLFYYGSRFIDDFWVDVYRCEDCMTNYGI